MFNRFITYLHSGNQRTQLAKKNIFALFINKGLAIIISLLLVPVTIGYLNTEQYGIWLTLSSIVAWISYFDVGLGHGFRNRFAEAKSNGDILLAKKYVSTTYAAFIVIFGIVCIVAELINPLIDWSSFIGVASIENKLLQHVVSILLIGFSLSFVLHVGTILLSADQKPAASAIITTIGQGVALVAIFILTKTTQGNMEYLAIALTWIPCIVVILVTAYMFYKPYKEFSPSVKAVDLHLVKNIMGLGVKFFIIQISMLLIFQVTNIILSRELGPNSVTEFNVSYKYFSITQMAFNIILAPFWSAYTEAYTNKDIDWMKRIYWHLRRIWFFLVLVNLVLLAISSFAFRIWLGDSIKIHWNVSIAMCIYLSILSYSNMLMTLLNGIGKVTMQMLIYAFCAILYIPICLSSCSKYGISGMVVILTFVYFVQAIFAKHQLKLILQNTASGIWNI